MPRLSSFARAHADLLPVLNQLVQLAMEDLEPRAMQQRITDALARHFAWEFVALVSIDQDRQRFVCEAVSTALPTAIHVGYSRPLGSGVVGQVAASGQPVLVADAAQYPDFVHTLPGGQSELAMPVLYRQQVIAVLNLESRRAHAFDDQVELLGIVCEHIAGAIQAAHRHAELSRRYQWLEFAAAVTHDALAAPDLDALLSQVLSHLDRQFDTAEATVLLESDIKDHLEVMAHRGASAHITYLGKQWPVFQGLVGRCYRSGQMQHSPDVRLDPDYSVVNVAVASEVAVPIRFRDRVFGVLNLESQQTHAFDALSRNMLQMLADQLGGAIHLSALNRRLQAQAQLIDQQNHSLTHTRESLKRAVGKLQRRTGVDQETGLADAVVFESRVLGRVRRARIDRHTLVVAELTVPPLPNDQPGQNLRRLAASVQRDLERAGALVARLGTDQIGVLADAKVGADLVERLIGLLRPYGLIGAITQWPPQLELSVAELRSQLQRAAAAPTAGIAELDLQPLARLRRGRGRPKKANAVS